MIGAIQTFSALHLAHPNWNSQGLELLLPSGCLRSSYPTFSPSSVQLLCPPLQHHLWNTYLPVPKGFHLVLWSLDIYIGNSLWIRSSLKWDLLMAEPGHLASGAVSQGCACLPLWLLPESTASCTLTLALFLPYPAHAGRTVEEPTHEYFCFPLTSRWPCS